MPDENLDEQQNEIKSYFDEIIKGYVAHDIRTLLDEKFSLDKKEIGGCAVPLAMCIFSAMNQLGYLTSNKQTDDIEKNPSTELCIKEFCRDWMSKVDNTIYNKSTSQEILINFFRHGLAHQFMPIAYMAITRHPDHKNLIESYEKEGKIFYILQVKLLAEHFLNSIDFLEQKIHNARKTDAEFISRFHRRLDKQRCKYIEENESLFKKAEKNLTVNMVKTEKCNTTTSGTKTEAVCRKTTYTC